MDQLRYYLAVCLFLITTNSASASVTDALSEAGFSCLAATDGSGVSFGGTMCTHEAMSTSAFTLDEAIAVMSHQRQARSYVISSFICKAFAASAATQELRPPT
jgi:hypothetical protein